MTRMIRLGWLATAGLLVFLSSQSVGTQSLTAQTANLWVDGGSGSCLRSPTAAAYNPATACATADNAYDAANASSAESLILIKGGTYAAFHLTGRRSSPERIIFDSAAGEKVLIRNWIRLGTFEQEVYPSYVTIRNVSTDVLTAEHMDPGVSRFGIALHYARDIRLEHIVAGGFLFQGTKNVALIGGAMGPCRRGQSYSGCEINKVDAADGSAAMNCTATPGTITGWTCYAENTVIDGVDFHDYTILPSCQSGCHWRPMYVNRARGFTLRNSTFRNFVFEPWATISNSPSGQDGNVDLLIENNEFGNNSGSSSVTGGGFGLAWCVNVSSGNYGYRNVTIRFNSYAAGAFSGAPNTLASNQTCRVANIRMYGNIMRSPGPYCQLTGPGTNLGTVEWNYNVFTGSTSATCGITDVYVGGTGHPFYTSDTSAPTPGAYALTGATFAADNLVPAGAGCPSTDRLGRNRPQTPGFCDAGAHERPSSDSNTPPQPPTNVRIIRSTGST